MRCLTILMIYTVFIFFVICLFSEVICIKAKKYFWSKIAPVLLVFILCILIAYFILILYRTDWISLDELNSVATVAGGGATLLGVVMTLNHANRKKKEDLAIQYKPIVLISDTKVEPKHFEYFMTFDLVLKNIGHGEAIDVNIIAINSTSKNRITLDIHKSNYKIIAAGCDINYPITICVSDFKDIFHIIFYNEKFTFDITYYDAFKHYQYIAEIEFKFIPNYDNKTLELEIDPPDCKEYLYEK